MLIAPYDVRQGNFAGGLINAVTQSGTNQFHGSVFGRYQNQDLVGTDVNGLKSADFKVLQYGGTLGGAIIQDKLQYFFAADISERTTPFDGITLEESLALWERGEHLATVCQQWLDGVRERLDAADGG